MLLGLRIGRSHDESLGAWLAKESVRDIYLTDDPARPPSSWTRPSPAARRRRRGDPLPRQDPGVVAHGDPGPPRHRASNGPTEGLNLLVKKVKRGGHGFRNFEHYRLRVLLHAGGGHLADSPICATHPSPLSPSNA